ncbi:MAG TPA: VIT and VWA domain-containing protein [Bryobacteraceae bacterium]|nr:VIT and VWA domain-containing protein [Bryobacteraceae bacterium]
MKAKLPFLMIFMAARLSWGDAGVLLPADQKQPNAAWLSLEEMFIDIHVDNGHARVSVRQIFANHRGNVLEGNYIFALPGGSIISDFAVWDDVTRIPGVILERRRAEEIYQQAKAQAIDPGLLQQGERDLDEASRGAVFSARIVPIHAYGTKRLEIEYQEELPVEQFESFLAVPLRPDAYRAQTAGHLSIKLDLESAHSLRDFQAIGKTYPLQVRERTPHRVRADYDGRNVVLSEDFAVKYALDPAEGDRLQILTHRDPAPPPPDAADVEAGVPATPAPNATPEPGFFEASVLIGTPPATPGAAAPSKTVIALFDNSLSMQWEKLDRNFQALERLLHALKPADKFNLLLFNTTLTPFSPAPVAAAPDQVEKALAMIRASRLRGGTDLQKALDAALAQSGPDTYLVLLSDGDATRGLVQNGKLAEWYAAKWTQKPPNQRPRTYIYAVGDDANMPLFRMLARHDGLTEWVRSTEPADFKLNAFLAKIGRQPAEGLTIAMQPDPTSLVYPLGDSTFPGSVKNWVGEYRRPAQNVAFTVHGTRDGKALNARATANLPAQDPQHPDLPRMWAKARVDALLEKIEREGEDQATIDEIIRLARKYKFVTPYTSFLAAPRALLRPRLIRPGDPVLRVKTDTSIVSVTALFPFGPVKSLRYLSDEDTWQTRFLAPSDLEDGSYRVRLILRDKLGHVYREAKTFVIASKPPTVRVKLDKQLFHRGEAVRMRVSASDTTRTVVARMYGAQPVYLRWNPEMSSNTGQLIIPAYVAPGKYVLTVTAEDFAHNIGSQEVHIEVAP